VTSTQKLQAEIDDLQRRIACMGMGMGGPGEVGCEPGMDEPEESGMDELGMPPMDAPVPVEEEELPPLEDEGELPPLDEDEDDELAAIADEAGCGIGFAASEEKPGIEDEITQDRFSEVEEEAHGKELATDESMHDAATASDIRRWKRASARLDRVADYLEKHGEVRLAFRVDKLAEAVDEAITEQEQEGE
jgi:hypothetical protein